MYCKQFQIMYQTKIYFVIFSFFSDIKITWLPDVSYNGTSPRLRHGRDELKANSGNAETLETPLLCHWSIRFLPSLHSDLRRYYLPYNRSLSFSLFFSHSLDLISHEILAWEIRWVLRWDLTWKITWDFPAGSSPHPSYSFMAKSFARSSSTSYSPLTPLPITPTQRLLYHPSKAHSSRTLFNISCSQPASNPHEREHQSPPPSKLAHQPPSQNSVPPTPIPHPSLSFFPTSSSHLSIPLEPLNLSLSLSPYSHNISQPQNYPPNFSTINLLLDLIVKSILPLLYDHGLSEDASLITFTLTFLLSCQPSELLLWPTRNTTSLLLPSLKPSTIHVPLCSPGSYAGRNPWNLHGGMGSAGRSMLIGKLPQEL